MNSAPMKRTGGLSLARYELPGPTFDVDEQPEVENDRVVEGESEVGDVRVLKWLSPIPVYPENSPQDRFPDPVDTREGTNRLGNEWRRDSFGDGTNEYKYENQDGSFYEKHRDDNADFLSSRGYGKHYPAASRNAPETR